MISAWEIENKIKVKIKNEMKKSSKNKKKKHLGYEGALRYGEEDSLHAVPIEL